jgi:hypothetical protein
MADLDPIALSQAEFLALLNYSASLPTGTSAGKRWRRSVDWRFQELNDEWMMGEFGEPYPKGHVLYGNVPVQWRRIIVLGVPARWPHDVAVPLREIPRRNRS